MKKSGIFIAAACFGCVAALNVDMLRKLLFNGKYDDEYLKLLKSARLAGDLLMWPVNYIVAMLP